MDWCTPIHWIVLPGSLVSPDLIFSLDEFSEAFGSLHSDDLSALFQNLKGGCYYTIYRSVDWLGNDKEE